MHTNNISVKDASGNDMSISVKEIAEHCNNYKGSDAKRSISQLIITLLLFFVTCSAMVYFYESYYWVTALLTLPAAGFLTRVFIFQHDCGHGSFFSSQKANDWVGRCLGVLTVTPYSYWRRAHNMHHATSGDLDRRSIGGIDTLTVREYNNLTKKQKFIYRLYRNPVALLIFGTPFYVLFAQRIPLNLSGGFIDNYKALSPSSIWKSMMSTNVFIIIAFGLIASFVGLGTILAVYLPVLVITSWMGGWLFFIQHQFEDTYWEKNNKWDTQESALLGSSYYDLPKVIQWFTGNIGLHHIHHLCSKIPNYKLQECMDTRPELKVINRLTFMDSLKCLRFKLWDEEKGHLVGFETIKA